MIAEGVISLIWVTLGMSFYPDTAALAAALGPKGNAALVVNNISVELLGAFGGAHAVPRRRGAARDLRRYGVPRRSSDHRRRPRL